ncbi:MAG: tetratricopeptide repeat protein [Nitrospirae bacterium]|nr:tetratricopeptide repeat protein [Nitrospirota bacterium]
MKQGFRVQLKDALRFLLIATVLGGGCAAWVHKGNRPAPIIPMASMPAATDVRAVGQTQESPMIAAKPEVMPERDQARVRSAVNTQRVARVAMEGQRHAAFSLARTGWRLVETGDYLHAAQAFTEAAERVPDEASFLVGLGLSQHRLLRDDLAVAALERAVHLDFYVDQGHKLLGDVYFRQGEIAAAIHHYETAIQQDPNDVALKESLAKARREYQAEANFDRLFSPHFVIKFLGSKHRATANAVAERLEMAYDEVGVKMSYFPAETFTVVLYPEGQFRDVTLSPDWARGLFDGRIHLPIEDQGTTRTPAVSDAVLIHEYAHAVVHRLSAGHAPTWLNEGLALYFEGRATSWGHDILARQADEIAPLSSLHGSFLGLPPRTAAVAYAESYWATQALVKRYGIVRVRQLLEALSVTPDFPKTFEAVLKDRYREFDATWMTVPTWKRG